MTGNHLSLILLSTLKCNAACEYCFEDKTNDRLDHEKLTVLINKVLDYMEEKAIGGLTIYWQGGEALLLPPSWYEQAYRIIQDAADSRHKRVSHALQTNMLTYSARWNQVIAHMFGNSVGTSLDYPNLYRKVLGRSPGDYNALWTRKVQEARTAGIDVKVISVLNQGTLDIGAERFYTYFVDALQVDDFQVNTPFPGGESNTAKQSLPLEVERLSQFHLDLADIWIERGYHQGVKIGPFDELLNYFTHQEARLPCIWGQNCAEEFVSIDARGYVAQCDCWVTSYPEYFYGNIFDANSFSELLRNSPARRRFYERPIKLMQRDCIECDYLSLCHGGCPVRTYTVHGSLFEKDPYCYLYKSLFRHMEKTATRFAARTAARQAVPVREPGTLTARG